MNKKSKKAQIEVSFNWVFVLIAGAIILFFFVRVITSETEITQTASHTRAANRMNAVITALQQNPDSVSVQDRINYEIQFYCNIEGQSYDLKGSNTKQYLPHQIVFAPEIIGESKLITWVRTFKAPMPIASVLYITDEQTKYVFITDGADNTNLIENYYNLFPDNISKELTTLSNFINSKDTGYRQYIVIINQNVATAENFGFDDKKLLSKVKFLSVNNNKEIKFYKIINDANTLTQINNNGNNNGKSFTEESIIGAIITGDLDIYECIMDKVLEQVRIIADINVDRIKLMHNQYLDGESCKGRYSAITQKHFEDLSDYAKYKNYAGLNSQLTVIEELNRQITQAGCPVLY
jgi:hypothetical protein